MKKEFSLYLDLLRFLAATLVFMTHSVRHYPTDNRLFHAGHEAVMIFFVLSGFVIAFVRDTKENTLREYGLSRVGRIYSVAVPALLLTVVADYIGQSVNAASYGSEYVVTSLWPVRFISSLVFTNELWFVSIQSFSNVPYWSLNYEIWYYISFACIAFFPGRKGWMLFAACLLIMGPKIALLAPIWWVGVWCYRTTLWQRLSAAAAWMLVALSVAGILAYFHFGVGKLGADILKSWIGPELHTEMAFSRWVLGDYVLTVFIVMHFVGMRRVAQSLGPVLLPLSAPIRWAASFTFIFYLCHQPLLLFYSAVLGTTDGVLSDYLLLIAVTLVTIVALGTVTERRKHLVKRWAASALDASVSLSRRKTVTP